MYGYKELSELIFWAGCICLVYLLYKAFELYLEWSLDQEAKRLSEADEHVRNNTGWRHWFAWHPVRIDDDGWIWFRKVERRILPNLGDEWGTRTWYYRLPS